ncbi:hypothetical protein [Anoxybacteroides tepidamans]|uniref:hypothetical protein n=1 Tax=Anoxybacteroides tepidamans TaxID=265948 RepID=UPI000486116B|nr:hypothetical protein [Anoxybacillus tepidamans]
MKKLFFFVILLVFALSGCGSEFISFSGESKNWKGEYSANIDGNSENGNYLFSYKHAKKNTEFKNLQIIINDSGKTVLNEETHKGATIKIPTGCSGCDVTKKGEPIKVTIKWNQKNEETFYLK